MVATTLRANESEVIAMPFHLADRLARHLPSIQMLPTVAVEALEMTKDPECRIGELSRVLQRDIRLATDLLRIVNSSLYSPGRPVVSLTDAALRLGLNRCRNLIITTSLSSLLDNLSLNEQWIREMLWEHSRLTAVLATNLNRELRAGFQGEEFSASLLHDVGRILLAVAVPEEFHRIDSLTFDEGLDQLNDERNAYGITHAELGAWFALRNQLPAMLVMAIRYHHMPQLAQRQTRLASVVAAADHMANFVHRGLPTGEYRPETNEAVFFMEASGVSYAQERFAEAAQRVLVKSQDEAHDLSLT